MDHRDTRHALDHHLSKVRVIAASFLSTALFCVAGAVLAIDVFDFEALLAMPAWVPVTITIALLPVIFFGYFIPHTMIKSARESNVYGLLGTHARAMIVAAIIRNAAVLVALALTLLTGERWWVMIVAGLAVFSSIVHWPRRHGIEKFIDERRSRG